MSTPTEQKSTFIVTYRLKPEQSFAGLKYQLSTVGGYTLTFDSDILWITFDAYSKDTLNEMNKVSEILRDVLAILTFQIKHPLDFDLISYVEDKPRETVFERSYGVARLGTPVEPPKVTATHIEHGTLFNQLVNYSRHFRYAIHDYSVALSLGREAIVFCARSVEWIQGYFQSRKLMKKSLCLPEKHLRLFFKLANETVIARHAGNPEDRRLPTLEEIRFSIVFTREIVLERFRIYLWYELSREDPPKAEYPEEMSPPSEYFEAENAVFSEELEMILSKNYPGSGLSYVLGAEPVTEVGPQTATHD